MRTSPHFSRAIGLRSSHRCHVTRLKMLMRNGAKAFLKEALLLYNCLTRLGTEPTRTCRYILFTIR